MKHHIRSAVFAACALGLALAQQRGSIAVAEDQAPSDATPRDVIVAQPVGAADCEGVIRERPYFRFGDAVEGTDFEAHAVAIQPDRTTREHFGWYAVVRSRMDIDNDGVLDEVLWVDSDSHYFNGNYAVLLPPNDADLRAKALQPLDRGAQIAEVIARFRKAGLSVYSGSETVYVDSIQGSEGAERYTRFEPVVADGVTFLWAHNVNSDLQPLAVLYRPGPGGRLEPVCNYDWR